MAESVKGTGVDPEKILRYEQFLNERLKTDLKKTLDERDKLYEELAEYCKLRNVIERLMESELQGEAIKTKVDLGCNFYVQAKVPQTGRINVYVGFGFFVEFTYAEALKFIEKKSNSLMEAIGASTKSAATIKANIKVVLEGLREIQLINDKEEKPQRDIFS